MRSEERLASRRNPALMAEMIRRRKSKPDIREELRISKHRFEVAFEKSPDANNITTLDGTFVAVNEGFCNLIGYSKEELEGKRSIDLGIWEDVEVRGKFIRDLEESGEVQSLIANFRKKDGNRFTGMMRAKVMEIDGKMVNFSVIRDLTAEQKHHQEIEAWAGKLERSHVEAIESLVKMIDWKDKETEGHSERVASTTVRLLRYINGFSEQELESFRLGALLHDIGKVGIPDSILQKDGQLTSEEWSVMKKHPELAYELMSANEFMCRSVDIPYCHHERWDGNGYPRGLKGEEIPLAARIFTVVDVWDALTTPRVYRAEAYSHEKAREMIWQDSGKAFDPKVVQAFFDMMDGKEKKMNKRVSYIQAVAVIGLFMSASCFEVVTEWI